MTIKNEKIMANKMRRFRNEDCARFALFLDTYGIRYENEGKWFKLHGFSYGGKNPGKPCPNGSVVACVEQDEDKWLERSGILYVFRWEQGVDFTYLGLDGDYSTALFCDGKGNWDNRCFTLCGDDGVYLEKADRRRAKWSLEKVLGARTTPLPVAVKGRGESVDAGLLFAWGDIYLWIDDENPWAEATLILNNP